MIKLLSKAVASGVVYARTQIDTPERTRIRSRSGELLHSTPKSASVKREISKNLEKVTRLTAPYPVRVRSRSGFSEVVQSRWIPVSYVSNLSKRADTSQGLNPEAVEVERRIDRRLMISAGAFGIGIASAAYPPLIILALPCILYTTAPFFKDAYKAVFEDNKIRVSVLDAIVVTGMIATGRWFLMTVTAFLGNGSFKLMMKAQDNSLKGVIDIFRNQSKTAWLKQSDHEVETPIESLVVGDIIVIHAGETVPVDGIIHEGICSIDQHALTGESQPAERGPGDPVLATSIILSGKIEVRVQTVGTETVAARIADIINNTSDYSSSLQMRGQAISDKGSVPTLVVGALALPFAGLSGALAVLCSALGWNMRIIAPISTLNFLRLTSEHGILIKDGRALESLDGVDTIVFDKTGTLTLDQPHVAQIYAFGSYPEDLILTLAAAAESRQSHPIARAIIKAAKERNLTLPGMEDAHYEIGYGIQVTVAGKSVQVGSARYMGMSDIEMPVEAEERQQIAYESGHSMVFVAIEGVLAGVDGALGLDDHQRDAVDVEDEVRDAVGGTLDLHESQWRFSESFGSLLSDGTGRHCCRL